MEEMALGLVYSSSIFFIFILSCFSVGKFVTSSLSLSLPFISEYKLIIGFFIHVILFSFVSILLPTSLVVKANYLLFFSCIFIAIGSIQTIRERCFKFKTDLSLLFLFALYITLGLALARFHSSPDNHGLAATISYLRDNINFHFLQKDFIEATQSNIPAHLGQKTELLNSTWNIADARLRFTSDTILTVGRIGIPLLISSLILPFNISYGFSYLLMFFGIFGAWILIKLVQDAHREMRKQFFAKDIADTLQRKLIRVLLVLSPLVSVWILEGTLNQLMLLVGISWQLLLHLKVSQCKDLAFTKIVLVQSIGLLFTVFVYPHGLPYALMVFLLGNIYELRQFTRQEVFSRIRIIALQMTLVAIPLIVTLRYTFLPLIKSFLSGVSGAPYNLGAVNIFDALFWPNSSVNFSNASGPGAGFGSVSSNYSPIAFQTAFFSLFLVFYVLKSRLLIHRKIVICLLLFIVLLPIQMFIFGNSDQNSYIYIRYLALYLVLSMPFISVIRIGKSSIHSKAATYFTLFLVAIQIVLFSHAGKTFIRSSTLFTTWSEGFDSSIFRKDSIFVSDSPSHSAFSLTNFGPFVYLTDNWNPRLNPRGIPSSYKIYRIKLTNGKYNVEFVDDLVLREPLDGPISYSQIKEYISVNEK